MIPIERFSFPVFACALALASGCAPGRAVVATAPIAPAAPPADESDAERVAGLLVEADAAGEGERRDRIVVALARSGLEAIDGSEDDPLSAWRAQSSLASPPMRGRALGRGYRRAIVEGLQAVELEQLFLAGEAAEVAAAARGGTPIGFLILDRKGSTVCETQIAPKATCRWLPSYSARYTIRLANRSEEAASVYLVVD